MTKKALITIGITAYNAGDTLDKAIASALAQDWEPTEIIIVDDASSDNSLSIAQAAAEKNDNIIVISHAKNKGVAAARNTLIESAKGEFIAFFDDDDVSAPNRLSAQYQRIIELGDKSVICYSARTQIYPDGRNRVEPAPIYAQGSAMAARILTGKPLKNGFGSMATCAQMARTGLYRQLGGFDETFKRSEDTDFNVRAALAGAYFIGVEAPLVTQQMTYGSEKTLAQELTFGLKLLEKHAAFVSEIDNVDFCRAWLINKHRYLKGDKAGFALGLFKLILRSPLRSLKRIMYAAPNRKFNQTTRQFHQNHD